MFVLLVHLCLSKSSIYVLVKVLLSKCIQFQKHPQRNTTLTPLHLFPSTYSPPLTPTHALLNNLGPQTGVRYTLHGTNGYQKKKAVEILPLSLYSPLFRQKQGSRLLISVLHEVWVTVKNASYVGKVWVSRLYCCGRFFPQINESLDTWQVSVCKSLGRRSRHCSLFLSV